MDRREQKDGINEATFVTIKKRKAAKNPNAEGERSWVGMEALLEMETGIY